MTQVIHLIEVVDPLNARNRNLSRHEWRESMTIADLYPTGIGTANLAISVNGGIVEQSKMGEFRVMPGDFVVIAPIPEGGGGGKTVLRLVAMIALSVASGGIAGAIYGAVGGTFVSAGAALSIGLIQAGVMVAGGMLINAILPMPKPSSSSTASTDQESPTYGADGAKNTSVEGIPVPVPYGTFRSGGNIIGLYTVNESDPQKVVTGSTSVIKTGQRQWLHMLINLGEGPVSAISNIEVNDQPIESFVWRPEGATVDQPAYQYAVYLGTDAQGPIQWFDKSITPDSVQTKFLTSWTSWTTNGEVDRLRIDLFSSAGIFKVKTDGSIEETSFDIEVQYRTVGSGTWLPFSGYVGNSTTTERVVPRVVSVARPWSYTYEGGTTEGTDYYNETYRMTGNEIRDGAVYRDAAGNIVADIYVDTAISATGIYTIKAGQRNGWRASLTSVALTEGEYEVRFRRVTAESTDGITFNELYVSDINEIRDETVGYRNTALLAVRLLMTDKLSGIPNVTCKLDGRVIKTWNASLGVWQNVHSANPAWITFDALTHKRYGGGSPESRFDIEMWKEWAAYCDDEGLEFHGIFDTAQTVWDATQKILRVGHAQVVPMGTKFTVAIERPSAPQMQFSVANMVEGTFKINWLPVAERSNEIELTYQDAADSYKQHTIKAIDTAALASGQAQRTSQVTMMGIVTAQQAWNEAHLMLNMNRYILQTVEFSAPAEAIGCMVGDVVLVQHDMPQWGFAGRTEVGSTTTTLKLDRPVTMQFGLSYQALVHANSVVKFSGTVQSRAGNSVILNGYTGSTDVRRLVVGSVETAVLSVFQSGPNWGVIVEDGTGISAGNGYQLLNTDEIVTRAVINPTSIGTPTMEVTEVVMAIPLQTAPAQFVNWMFGEVGKVAKPFRIRSIGGDDAVNRDIVAIEYNESVYDPAGAAPTPNYSSITNVVEQAVIFGVRETLKLVGDTYKSVVTISFGPASPRSNYSRSEVLASVGSDPWKSLGFSAGEMSLEAAPGEIIRFKVIARDNYDRPASGTAAPETSYRVTGQTTVPGAVSGIAATIEDTGIRLSWNPPDALNWNATAVRRGATGTWDTTAVHVFGGRSTSVLMPFMGASTWRFLFRHEMTGQSSNSEAFYDLVIAPPATATPVASNVQSGSFNLYWGDLKTTQPIKSHEIRVGASWASATQYAVISGSSWAHAMTFQGDGIRRVWVAATDAGGNTGTPAYIDVSVTTTGNGDTTAPPTPTGISVTSRFGTNYVRWDSPSYVAGGGHEESVVFAATWTAGPLPTIAEAVPIGTVTSPGNGWADVAGPGTQRHYWVVHKSKAGIFGPAGGGTNGVQIVTVKLGSADMDDAIITTAKFAGGIEPITLVTSVPTSLVTQAIFNQTDGKLYRWNATLGEYKTMPASELSTQVSAAELAADSVIAGKVAAGAISAREVAAQAIRTDKLLVTGQGAAINADPNTVDISAWSGGTGTIVADATSPSGSTLAVTSIGVAIFGRQVPLAASKNYDLRISVKRVSGAATCYLGIAFVDAAGATLNGYAYPTGWPSTGEYHYFGLLGTSPSTSWTEYRISFGPGEVAKIPPGAVACAIVLLPNYTGGAGEQRFTNIRLVEKTDADLIVDGTIGATKMVTGLMSADNVLTRGLTVRDAAGNIIMSSGIKKEVSENMCGNPSGDVNVDGWNGDRVSRTVHPFFGDGTRPSLYSQWTDVSFGGEFKVEPGESWFVSWDTLPAGGGTQASGRTISLGVYIIDTTGTVIAVPQPAVRGPAVSGPSNSSGTFVVPAGAYKAVIYYSMTGLPRDLLGPSDGLYFRNVVVRKKINAANASTFIDNAAINTAQIGSLNAGVIEAGSITTSKIRVGDVSVASATTYSDSASTLANASFQNVGPFTILGSFTGTGVTCKYVGAALFRLGLISNASVASVVVSATVYRSGSATPVASSQASSPRFYTGGVHSGMVFQIPLVSRFDPGTSPQSYTVLFGVAFYDGSGNWIAPGAGTPYIFSLSGFVEENKV